MYCCLCVRVRVGPLRCRSIYRCTSVLFFRVLVSLSLSLFLVAALPRRGIYEQVRVRRVRLVCACSRPRLRLCVSASGVPVHHLQAALLAELPRVRMSRYDTIGSGTQRLGRMRCDALAFALAGAAGGRNVGLLTIT